MPTPSKKPKHFFLNQRHELLLEDKSGRVGIRYYRDIDWAVKGRRIHGSIEKVKAYARASIDPLREKRYFILAAPESQLIREPGKKATSREPFEEHVEFAGAHARDFAKLGLDLLTVHQNGSATVHADAQKIEQLEAWATAFDTMGVRDKARWASVAEFGLIPLSAKVDAAWLMQMKKPGGAYIELQPLLDRLEADEVIRVIDGIVRKRDGESLRGVSSDYSGRVWLYAVLSEPTIREIAESLSSVDSIHAPLLAVPSAPSIELRMGNIQPPVLPLTAGKSPRTLPCVAVVDTGAKQQHLQLAPFMRDTVVGDSPGERCTFDPSDSHGTQVASRVVFGDIQTRDLTEGLKATCSFFNVSVALRENTLHPKSVVNAMRDVVSRQDDVRVFNLSIDADRQLDQMDDQLRRSWLKLIEDLDMFIFENDVVVVVAAGNSIAGKKPDMDYPRHIDDPAWELRTWSRAFNSLTCGGAVPRTCVGAVAREPDAPSPFTRVGYGFGKSPKPDFCEVAGDCAAEGGQYREIEGAGVFALLHDGYAIETTGTSLAAPLLAREAALAFEHLRREHSAPGGRIFAVTVKAFLAATARTPIFKGSLQKLAKRTLGRGFANAAALASPPAHCARFIWQGIIPSHSEKVRVQLPIPKHWLAGASDPRLRIVCATDSPVHAAVESTWASRKVNLSLLSNPEDDPENKVDRPSGTSTAKKAYPLFERGFNLKELMQYEMPGSDFWTVRLDYTDTEAGYKPGPDPEPSQRVAFVAELWDAGEGPSPQELIQSLPMEATMDVLSPCVLDTSVFVGVPA